MKWCEHIEFREREKLWFYKYGQAIVCADSSKWSVCPECQAERPKEPKKMAKIIYEVHKTIPHIDLSCREKNEGMWEAVAQAAVDAVCEAIDDFLKKDDTCAHRDDLQAYLRRRFL